MLNNLTCQLTDFKIGKVVHFGADLALLSGFLAGVHRSTGLTPNIEKIGNKDAEGLVKRYLDAGEWAFDSSVAYFGASDWFKRN